MSSKDENSVCACAASSVPAEPLDLLTLLLVSVLVQIVVENAGILVVKFSGLETKVCLLCPCEFLSFVSMLTLFGV